MKNNTTAKLELLKGARIYAVVARRHGVTKVYARQIALGLRETNTEKAKAIAKDLEETARFICRPVTASSVK